MGWFSQKTPQEVLRENKRMLDRSIRELDRERTGLEAQERKTDVVRLMARDVVRIRGQVTKFYKMRAQMQSVSMQMQTMKSQQAMARGMTSVTRSLQVMNRQMNMPMMQKMMMEFEKQNEMMEFKQEMMDDVMDDVLSAENEEERTEDMVNQVLDEVGISVGSSMAAAPTQTLKKEAEEAEDQDLQARLDSLRALK